MNKVALSGFSGVRSAAHTAHEAASVTFDFVSSINVENALPELETVEGVKFATTNLIYLPVYHLRSTINKRQAI